MSFARGNRQAVGLVKTKIPANGVRTSAIGDALEGTGGDQGEKEKNAGMVSGLYRDSGGHKCMTESEI